MLQRLLLGLTLAFALAPAQASTQQHGDIDPEFATGTTALKRSHSQQYMAVTANPHATKAASEILAQGGSAVDAAIAAQLVLGLVEPQSSGIGGGAFLMHWDAKAQQLQLFDGRETAPAAIDETYYIGLDKKPMSFYEVLIGGYSVGTPGVIKMMAQAHQQHGQLPWQSLFTPAISLAQRGFAISPRLNALLTRFNRLLQHPSSRQYFYQKNGQAKAVGTLLKNPDYANSLALIAKQPIKAFYQGSLAKSIVKAVQDDSVRAGKLTLTDIKNYQSVLRKPLCGQYSGYKVCSTPPPSSGAAVLQILGILDQLPKPMPEPGTVEWVHRFAEASKLAFADRDTYIADPDFVNVPTEAMIEPGYLKQRAALINLQKASTAAQPGKPDKTVARLLARSPEFPSTTHLSIVDAKGNAVSMTSSVQMAFGSGVMVGGFLLNNQLTDFSFVPEDGQQQLIANRVQAGKRPRSSMSPTIIFKDNKPVMLIGSPGGSRIIDYVARVIAYTIDSDMDIAEAIASPNVVHMNRKLELEEQGFDPKAVTALKKMGHEALENSNNSGLHGIWIDDDGLTGGADPRREGTAAGR